MRPLSVKRAANLGATTTLLQGYNVSGEALQAYLAAAGSIVSTSKQTRAIRPVVIRQCDVSGFRLEGGMLQNVIFNHCEFYNCLLVKADCRRCTFALCRGSGITFRECDLKSSDLHFDTSGPILIDCVVDGASLRLPLGSYVENCIRHKKTYGEPALRIKRLLMSGDSHFTSHGFFAYLGDDDEVYLEIGCQLERRTIASWQASMPRILFSVGLLSCLDEFAHFLASLASMRDRAIAEAEMAHGARDLNRPMQRRLRDDLT